MNEGPRNCPVGDKGVEGPKGVEGIDILTRLKRAFPECEKIQHLVDLSSGIMLFNCWAQQNADHLVSEFQTITKADVTIESNGDRYIYFTDQNGCLLELTLPYELTDQFIKDMQVITDRIERRNQIAWEAIEEIRKLDIVNIGSIANCIKDVPLADRLESAIKEQLLQDTTIYEADLLNKKSSSVRRVRLKRDLDLPEELGMVAGAVFETSTTAKDVVCVKSKTGQFVTLRAKDFEDVSE